MKYRDLTPHLLRMIPELGPPYTRFIEEWSKSDAPPELTPDLICASMVVPYVRRLLAGDLKRSDRSLALRIFAVLDELAREEDGEVQSVIEVTFCSGLIDERGTHKRAMPLLGPNLLASLRNQLDERRQAPRKPPPRS